MGFVYVPHGAIMDQWTPAAEGSGFEFSRILKPLEPFRDRLNMVSGLGNRAADSTAVHSLSPTTWLSGVRPKPTQGVDAYAGITADQIAAQHIGQDTPLPSIELATEDHSALLGRLRPRLRLHLHEHAVVAHAHHADADGDQSAQSLRADVRTGRNCGGARIATTAGSQHSGRNHRRSRRVEVEAGSARSGHRQRLSGQRARN